MSLIPKRGQRSLQLTIAIQALGQSQPLWLLSFHKQVESIKLANWDSVKPLVEKMTSNINVFPERLAPEPPTHGFSVPNAAFGRP